MVVSMTGAAVALGKKPLILVERVVNLSGAVQYDKFAAWIYYLPQRESL